MGRTESSRFRADNAATVLARFPVILIQCLTPTPVGTRNPAPLGAPTSCRPRRKAPLTAPRPAPSPCQPIPVPYQPPAEPPDGSGPTGCRRFRAGGIRGYLVTGIWLDPGFRSAGWEGFGGSLPSSGVGARRRCRRGVPLRCIRLRVGILRMGLDCRPRIGAPCPVDIQLWGVRARCHRMLSMIARCAIVNP
jgi:hypothetical protein